MSELISQLDLKKAAAYNAKQSYTLTPDILTTYPALSQSKQSTQFAQAVLFVQKDIGLPDYQQDAKLGRYTYQTLIQHIRGQYSEYILLNEQKIQMPKSNHYSLITYDEPTGLDLHRYGNFSKRKKPISQICLHWGGLNPKHCYNVFASNSRKVSSHFLIGLNQQLQPIIYQTLDLNHKAWHAGKFNEKSIGIDLCQQPSTKWKDHYEQNGYQLNTIQNQTNRGPKNILELHPLIIKATQEFIPHLTNALNINTSIPNDPNLYNPNAILNNTYNIYCHSMVSAKKWDIAPYWNHIFQPEL